MQQHDLSVMPDSASTTSISTSRQRRLAIAVKNKALEKEVVHGMIGDNSAAAGASLSFDINREEDGAVARSNACTTNTNHFVTPADSLVQSRNLCFPLRIVIAKDNKMALEGFRSLYKSFNSGDNAEATRC